MLAALRASRSPAKLALLEDVVMAWAPLFPPIPGMLPALLADDEDAPKPNGDGVAGAKLRTRSREVRLAEAALAPSTASDCEDIDEPMSVGLADDAGALGVVVILGGEWWRSDNCGAED